MRMVGRESGSVLMEYVIVNMLIAVPLLLLWHQNIYDFLTAEWRDPLGRGIQAMFQRVLSGIALPIP